jgi:hypothetical protein
MSPKKTTNYIVTKSNDYVVRNWASDPAIPFTSQTLTFSDLTQTISGPCRDTPKAFIVIEYGNYRLRLNLNYTRHCCTGNLFWLECEPHRTLMLRQLTLVGVWTTPNTVVQATYSGWSVNHTGHCCSGNLFWLECEPHQTLLLRQLTLVIVWTTPDIVAQTIFSCLSVNSDGPIGTCYRSQMFR